MFTPSPLLNLEGETFFRMIGVTLSNLSILKTNKARAIRFSTLEAICRELDCQPVDLLKYVPDDNSHN